MRPMSDAWYVEPGYTIDSVRHRHEPGPTRWTFRWPDGQAVDIWAESATHAWRMMLGW